VTRYVPRQGDFLTLSFDPQAGREQKGRRPALVVSNDEFNGRTGLAWVCPLTRTHRGYPLHLQVPAESSLTGFVMVEQLISVDYGQRGASFIERCSPGWLDEVLALVDCCLR